MAAYSFVQHCQNVKHIIFFKKIKDNMNNAEVDLVSVLKRAETKTLLEKYDTPIENLSYEYITKCTEANELEHIIVILRCVNYCEVLPSKQFSRN